MNDKTLFWVIGSVPDLESTANNLGREIPRSEKVYEFEEKIEVNENDIVKEENGTIDEWFSEEKELDPVMKKFKASKRPTLYYVKGGNGSGKCQRKDTQIDIEFKNKEVEEKFKEFLSL